MTDRELENEKPSGHEPPLLVTRVYFAAFLVAGATVFAMFIWGGVTLVTQLGHWKPVDSVSEHVTIFSVRGGGLMTPYAGVSFAVAGLILGFAFLLDYIMFRREDIATTEHTREFGVAWIFLAMAAGLLGGGGWWAYSGSTTEVLALDGQRLTVTLEKGYLTKTTTRSKIAFGDISAVTYVIDIPYPPTIERFDYPPQGWVELEVRGEGTVKIASGYPKNVSRIADALSVATGLEVITGYAR